MPYNSQDKIKSLEAVVSAQHQLLEWYNQNSFNDIGGHIATNFLTICNTMYEAKVRLLEIYSAKD